MQALEANCYNNALAQANFEISSDSIREVSNAVSAQSSEFRDHVNQQEVAWWSSETPALASSASMLKARAPAMNCVPEVTKASSTVQRRTAVNAPTKREDGGPLPQYVDGMVATGDAVGDADNGQWAGGHGASANLGSGGAS